MNAEADDDEIILIQPSFKAYAEFIAAGLIFLVYDGLIGVVILLAVWWHKASRKYEILPDRVVYTQGFIMKTTREFRISRIRDLTVKQGPLQKPLNVGNVILLSTQHDEKPLRITGVPHPVQLGKLLRKYYKDLKAAAAAAKAASAEQAPPSNVP